MLATIGSVVVLLGIPAAFAFAMGWFNSPREHVFPLVLVGIVVFFAMLVLFLIAAVVHVMTKDFVVPQMALEGVGAVEGWRRLWPMMQAERRLQLRLDENRARNRLGIVTTWSNNPDSDVADSAAGLGHCCR
jgi:hypothetical protein